MSTARRGSHARDPSVPPPVDPELTRLSVRWTRRALRSVFAVWVVAVLVGVYFDATSRYEHLTWIVAWGGRGGASFVWELEVPRGRLGVLALAVTGPALISSLIGASRMFTAARTGRPHRGPSRWSLVGIALAIGLGPNVVGCFVLSEIYTPPSDAVLLAGLAPMGLGVLGGLAIGAVVRVRYDPWRWAGQLRSPSPRAPIERRPGARVLTVRLDPATAVLTATYADGSTYEYAAVSEQTCALVSGRSGIVQREFLGRVAQARSFRRVGEPGWRPAPSTVETGLPPMDWLGWARDETVGAVPPASAAHPRAHRAHRAGAHQVRVTPAGVSWRTRAGRGGSITSSQIARVCLAEVTYTQSRTVVTYALVLDADGAALLRVSAGGSAAMSGAESKRRLSQMWAPLDVPVSRHTGFQHRPKDLRRCWPEAFGWLHAYPVLTVAASATIWMAVVVPLLDHVIGT